MSIGSIGNPDLPAHITIKGLCALVGGDKPVHPSTIYRDAELKACLFHPTPGIVRADTSKALAVIAKRRASIDRPGPNSSAPAARYDAATA
jgi:hypothetical protein